MREHTKKRHIKKASAFQTKKQKENDSINWQDAFKEAFGDMPYYAITLRGLRNREGWTQVELSNRTGISQTNLSKMENGKRSIGKNIAKKLAEVFKTNYRMFL